MRLNQVGFEVEALQARAEALALQLGFELNKEASSCLFLTQDKLALKLPHFSLISADFCDTALAKRKAEGKKQGLIRACKPKSQLKIIDTTAGWGRDAALLASFGADVLMLERNPVMGALLEDALRRLGKDKSSALLLSLLQVDATSFLNKLQPQDYPDVIYIDPMHPERNKAALVKKELQVLQQLLGADKDALELILCAISRVKQRVVVKWPQKTKALLPPDASIEGKTVRFDIYWPKLT